MNIDPEIIRTINSVFGAHGVLWAVLCFFLLTALITVTRFAQRLLERDMERSDRFAERYREDSLQMIDALNRHTASMNALALALQITKGQGDG